MLESKELVQMKKDDEAVGGVETHPFLLHLDKSTALQEARVFNETPIKPSRCCATLAKVLYLLYQGEVFQVNEATNLFFAVTKLFQSKDVKELSQVHMFTVRPRPNCARWCT